jgi:hypothetical protein
VIEKIRCKSYSLRFNISPCGYKLGDWVANLRRGREYQVGKNTVTIEQKKILEALPGWSWSPFESAWNIMFSNLKEYFASNNTSKISKKDNPKLYTWCRNQKKYYSKDKLSEYRIKKLESLNHWNWEL